MSGLAEGINRSLSDTYAFIGDKTAILTASAGYCQLDFMKEEFFKSGFGFAVRDGWPYTKYFDDVYVFNHSVLIVCASIFNLSCAGYMYLDYFEILLLKVILKALFIFTS